MADHEERYLQKCLADNVCPACLKPVVKKLGSGNQKDGVFCSLDCYANWHAETLRRRHQDRLKLKKDHTDG